MAQLRVFPVGRLLLAGLGLFVACGGDSDADLTVDQFMSEYLHVICDSFVNCGVLPDRDSCHSNLLGAAFSTLRADVLAKRVDFDGKRAGACLAAATDSLHQCDFALDPNGNQVATCEAVFTGDVAPGAACYFDDQCQAGSVCDQSSSGACDSACCAGVCKKVVSDIALGQACTADDTCVSGSYCLVIKGVGTCTQRIASRGTACTGGASCEPPLICAPDYRRGKPTFSSFCLQPGETGADCSEGAGTFCNDLRDRCDPVSQTCQRLPAVGAPCVPGPNILTGACAWEAQCDPLTNTCKLLGNNGDPCDSSGSAASDGCLLTLGCSSATETCQPESSDPCPAL